MYNLLWCFVGIHKQTIIPQSFKNGPMSLQYPDNLSHYPHVILKEIVVPPSSRLSNGVYLN